MTSVAEHHDAGVVHHGPPPPPRGWRRLLYPGMLRAAWMAPLFFGIGSGIVVLRRWWGEWHPIWFGEIIVLVGAHGRADRLRHPVAAAGTVTRARLHIHD